VAGGIGRAIVLLVDRDGQALEAAARERSAEAYAVDLALDGAPETAVEWATEAGESLEPDT